MKFIDDRKTKCCNICIAIFIAFMPLLMYFIVKPRFGTNDDSAMMYLIAGYFTGETEVLPYVLNIGYSSIVAALYEVLPIFPWYTLSLIGLQQISMAVIGYIFIKNKNEFRASVLIAVGVYIFLYVIAFMYPMIMLSYTTVSALCGAAAIMAVRDAITADDARLKKNVVRLIGFSILFYFTANLRMQIGFITTVIIICLVGGNYIISRRGGGYRLLVYLFMSLLILAVSACTNTYYCKNNGWEDFISFNTARAKWSDYEHLDYDNNSEIYRSIGWDKNDYLLAQKACLMMKNVNTETFVYLNGLREKENNEDSKSLYLELKSTLSRIIVSHLYVGIVLSWLVILVILSYLQLKVTNTESVYRKHLLMSWMCFLIFLCLIIYLSYIGRILTRLFFMCLILSLPLGIYEILCSMSMLDMTKVARIIIGVTVIPILIISGISAHPRSRRPTYELSNMVQDYVLNNKENFYVYDVSITDPYDPFKVFDDLDRTPVNMYFWGGWLYNSPLFYKQLQANGLTQLKLSDMLYNNMYFIGSAENMELLNKYYQQNYSNVEVNIIYECDKFIVYCYRKN